MNRYIAQSLIYEGLGKTRDARRTLRQIPKRTKTWRYQFALTRLNADKYTLRENYDRLFSIVGKNPKSIPIVGLFLSLLASSEANPISKKRMLKKCISRLNHRNCKLQLATAHSKGGNGYQAEKLYAGLMKSSPLDINLTIQRSINLYRNTKILHSREAY